MVFSTTNLFKGIPCPEGEKCTLTSCIFAHDLRPQAAVSAPATTTQATATASSSESQETAEPAAKRRRVTYEKAEHKPPSRADLIRDSLAKSRTQAATATWVPTSSKPAAAKTIPPSLTRSVSPPAKTNGKATSSSTIGANNAKAAATSQPTKASSQTTNASLNPRLIPNDPAGHAKRTLYVKHLHAEMSRLNQLVQDRSASGAVQFKAGLIMDDLELVQLALDEEEKLARESGNVYGNVIKNRIAAYKKSKADDWIVHLKTTPLFLSKYAAPTKQPGQPDSPKPITTGLTPAEEVAVLSHLVIKDQKPLAPFGYTPTPPTPAQAAEAAAAVEASKDYELCDRCSARFQVFPHRNEEGLLTSNGPCKHHPNRKVFPQKTKADTGPKEPYYPCCNEVVGSAGCTTTEYHVFKAGSPARLAAVLPFVSTPENERPARCGKGGSVGAVAFDCEMGYTTLGLELIRLTAVSWPGGEELVDVLVRPLGIVLDLNSRFSGVWPEDMVNATPYTTSTPPLPPPQAKGAAAPVLPIVDSPQKARELLCSYLTPTTPLIGHAIENDLNATRLCHPSIVDTVVLFPHSRGLPLRFGLRVLASKYLHRAIQQGGERGHDSLEDARATGDLVRVRVGEKWRGLKAGVWGFGGGVLGGPKGVLGDGDGGEGDKVGVGGGKKGRRGRDGDGSGLGAFLERAKEGRQELSEAGLEDE